MKKNTVRWVVLAFLTLITPAFGQVIINEIMYHPVPEMPEDLRQEWIELYNPSTNAVDITGWHLNRSINFTFTNSAIPAGGYLVVSANVDAFNVRYPNFDGVVVGNWVGELGNNGDTIELLDTQGNVVNSVHYGTQDEEWSNRIRGNGERQVTSMSSSGGTVNAYVFGHDFLSGDQVRIYGADQQEYNGIFSITITGPSTFTFNFGGSSQQPTGTIICRRLTDYGYYGWSWSSLADGLGRSLELINTKLPNQYGQNWTNSLVLGGTPGLPNSVALTNVAPLILDVHHFPLVPHSTDTITVTARLLDEHSDGLSATLYYRNVTTTSPGAWVPVTMYDDGQDGDGTAGDGIWGAQLPPQGNLNIFEFYVQASDAEGHLRTWPKPALNADDTPLQAANAHFQVDDNVYPTTQPLYRFIIGASDFAELRNIKNSDSAARGINTMENMTFITTDGAETLCKYLVGVRNRGAGMRGYRIMSYSLQFGNVDTWKKQRGINFYAGYTPQYIAGMVFSEMAGFDADTGRAVRIRVNGTDLQDSGSTSYGSYIQMSKFDSIFAQEHFPLDSRGNIYRGSQGGGPQWGATLDYLGQNPDSYYGQQARGYYKGNNTGANDWSDMIGLCAVLNTNTPDDAVYAASVSRVVNVEQWMKGFAVYNFIGNGETALQTGYGDDWAMYRGMIDPRFVQLGHDYDSGFGLNGSGPTNQSLWRMCTFLHSYSPGSWALPEPNRGDEQVPVLNRFMTNAYFAPVYYKVYNDLLNTLFTPANVSQILDQTIIDWAPSVLPGMKTYATNRYNFVKSRIPLNLTIGHALGIVNGYPRTTSPTVALGGQANAMNTRYVKVNGSNAVWTAWQARWTNNSVTLRPGINRILIQTFGTNNVELERGTIDVWYDNSQTTILAGGELNTSLNLYASNTPYRLTSSLIIPDETFLAIEPGTTLYLDPGVIITVNGSLRALGTETNHIRITRTPGSGNWGSIDFVGAVQESRLSYVDFDYSGGTTLSGHNAQIHVNNSVVFFDHLTWATNPPVQYISFDNSSFIVQNCTFPTYPAPTGSTIDQPELIHGVNGIPLGGYGIFRDNYFGHSFGYSDTIDFTANGNTSSGGGNRPAPILQFINNVFDGASDDHLDLDSTDAWIEGNIFMHAHRDPRRTDNPLDTSSAISGGRDFAGVYSEWTIINNLFYDLDHAVLAKQGGRFIFVNNTLVHINKESGAGDTNDIAAFDLTDVGQPLPDSSIGAGLYAAGNIIWDCDRLVANYNSSNQTVILENNILPIPWSGPGSNNLVVDPLLRLDLITNLATADWKTVKAAFQPQPGSPALGTGFGGYDRGGLNPAGLLVYGLPAQGTTYGTNLTLTVGPGAVFNWGSAVPPYQWGYVAYRWKLDNGSWSAEIAITNPTITLSNLSAGPHTLYVSGKTDAGYFQEDPFAYPSDAGIPAHLTARSWTVTTTRPGLRLNEILASNYRGVLHGENYPDMVELFNDSDLPADLSGLQITDDPTVPNKFIFPPSTILNGGGYLVLYADNPDGTPGFHLGFNLNKQGDSLYVYDSTARGGGLLDSVTFGLQITDLSIGRASDGTWTLTYPTFGAANNPVPLGAPKRLKINEWLAAELTTYPADFIELYNPQAAPVLLSGLYLTDNWDNWPTQYQVVPLSFIPAWGYTAFLADGNSTAGNDHLNFRLSADQGVIALLDPHQTLIDRVYYGPQYTDISQGRSPNGSDTIVSFTEPTPGAANPGSSGSVTITNIIQPLVNWANSWTYNGSRTDLGADWYATNYSDASWSSGAGLLYCGPGGPFAYPINTRLPLTQGNLPTTVYFRTHFTFNGDTNGFNLLLYHLIDDGAVFYLNGSEINRYNMPAAPTAIYYSTQASQNISGDPGLQGPYVLPLTNLLQGDNLFCAEVHQRDSGSSDILMGAALELRRSITNYLSYTVVLNELMAKNLSITNTDGTITDWVELFNPGTNVLDLAGMSLAKNLTDPSWFFPQGLTMNPYTYLVIRCDPDTPPLHQQRPGSEHRLRPRCQFWRTLLI